MSKSVVVIGGGVIGTACAHFLSKAGWRVTVIDRGAVGGGSSAANCGFVCPSHVLPLAEPGMVLEGVRSLLHRNSPLKIRPRPDPALLSWLIHFALRCNERDMLASARGIQPLLDASRDLYAELVATEGLECEWQTRGLLFAYRSDSAFNAYAPTDRLLSEAFGRPATRYDGDAVRRFEPALRPGLAGGWHYPGDAHLRPDELMRSWRSRLEASGVTFRERCGFQSFRRADGRAVAVDTEHGAIEAGAFVLAAGAWTPMLNNHLGCKIPIQPGKGYSLTMPRPSVCPTVPMIFPETRVAVTPFETGYRLGSMMEFAGYDESIRPERIQLLRDGAATYLQEPTAEPIERTWFGWRPMTWDGLPIIDRAPALNNVVIAAGHNMLGLSMAPATGRLVAEILNEQTPFLDAAPYRAGRF